MLTPEERRTRARDRAREKWRRLHPEALTREQFLALAPERARLRAERRRVKARAKAPPKKYLTPEAKEAARKAHRRASCERRRRRLGVKPRNFTGLGSKPRNFETDYDDDLPPDRRAYSLKVRASLGRAIEEQRDILGIEHLLGVKLPV